MALLLFVGFFASSCQKKEELIQKNNNLNEAKFRRDPKACLTPIKLFCDSILWFENQEHFDAVYQRLEKAYEAHNHWFDQQTANMTDDEAEEYALSINFDEDQPLIDFENFHKFYSYRKWLSDNEDGWVDNNISPMHYDYLLNDVSSALYSRSRMVRIGNITYFQFNNSIQYEICTDDCNIISRVLAEPESSLNYFDEVVTAPKHKVQYKF
jgi:hypothetical protein